MPDAFFLPASDGTFEATDWTRGPWSDAHQHGGPPSALVVRGMEAVAVAIGAPSPMRFTIDLLRPVPIGRMRVVTEPSPEGRGVRRILGSLTVEGVEVLRA